MEWPEEDESERWGASSDWFFCRSIGSRVRKVGINDIEISHDRKTERSPRKTGEYSNTNCKGTKGSRLQYYSESVLEPGAASTSGRVRATMVG